MPVRSNQTRHTPYELVQFDTLPDSAHVRLPTVCQLFSCSRATIWRGVKSGTIPAPTKLSANITAWNVGILRRALAEKSS